MDSSPAELSTADLKQSSTKISLKTGLGLLAAILAVSTASIFIRFAQTDAPSLVIAALRIAFASLALAPLALTRHRDELGAITRQELWLALFSGLFLAVHFATWISSLEYTTVASSVVFVSTGPLWVALVSPIVLKEHLSRAALVGLALALFGGTIVGLADACTWNHGLTCPSLSAALEGRAMWGNFLALIGAWAVTGYLVIGRKLRAKMSLIPYIFVVYSVAALALIIVIIVAHESPLGYHPITYLWILLLALIPQLIGHSTYNWALRYLPASLVATANLGEPIGSALLAYFILGEEPGTLKIWGALFILFGIYLSSRSQTA
ncbi:MAG TPA: DMT family transporter [Anaerolineales bacterium]|nr:DMT family transporter [Anaerolineales bacterium]